LVHQRGFIWRMRIAKTRNPLARNCHATEWS